MNIWKSIFGGCERRENRLRYPLFFFSFLWDAAAQFGPRSSRCWGF